MQFSLLLAALFAALTSAITINDIVATIPGCAHQCFADNIPKTGCDFIDNGCQCRPDKKAQLTTLLTPCILSSCDPVVGISIIGITDEICKIESANAFTVPGTQSVSVAPSVYASLMIPSPTAGGMPTAKPALAGAALLGGLAALAL